MKKNRFSPISLSIYAILTATLLWQGVSLYRQSVYHKTIYDNNNINVYIGGNVRRPGKYRVANGTTHFEILQVAGVRPTSDLSSIDLSLPLDSSQNIAIGTLDNPVKINQKAPVVRLEFYLGEVSLTGNDGRSIPAHEGLALSPGDRIQTETSAQAELSAGPYSRIDMDNFSEILFDKTGTIENDRSIVEVFQKNGICRYRIIYAKNSDLFKIDADPVAISVGGTGADFLIEVKDELVQISLLDGLLLLERVNSSEALNMINGQCVTVYKDGRPFEVKKIAQETNVDERFSPLAQEKIQYLSGHIPFNLLFCGTPAIFYLININYEQTIWNIIRIPPELLIEQFANNITTLNEAFLYGGALMVTTFVERILDTRIQKYIVFDKSDIIQLVGITGGVTVSVDASAASYLQLSTGKQKLSDNKLLHYLSPSISGSQDSWRRQSDIFRSIYEGLLSRNILPNLIFAENVVGSAETNLSAFELMQQYSKFKEKTNWIYREHSLPVESVKRDNKTCFEPQLEKCRSLLNNYE